MKTEKLPIESARTTLTLEEILAPANVSAPPLNNVEPAKLVRTPAKNTPERSLRRRGVSGMLLCGLAIFAVSFLYSPHRSRQYSSLEQDVSSLASLWSRPVALSKAAVSAASPVVAVNESGQMVAVWSRQQGSIYKVQASVNTGGKWSNAINLSPNGQTALEPSVAIDRLGVATAVWSNNNSIQSSTFTPNKGWSVPVAVSDLALAAVAPKVVIDGNGNATAMWVRHDLSGNAALETADRPIGYDWTTPVALTAAAPDDFILAMNSMGDTAAIWNTGSFATSNGIYVSIRLAETNWSTPYPIAPAAPNQGGDKIGITANGDVTACWRSNNEIRVADKPADGNWGPIVTLYNNSGLDDYPVLQEASSGDAVIGWVAYGRIYTSQRLPGAAWSAPLVLTSSNEYDEDLRAATTADGSHVFTWVNRNKFEFKSSICSPSGSWSTPVIITRTQKETGLAAAGHTALAIWLSNSFVATVSTASMTQPPNPGNEEQYGTSSTGVALRWTVFEPAGGGRHPAVLVLHPGGFKAGKAGPPGVAQDLAAAGFLALATEYRLAPPHTDMNTPAHAPPSQNTVSPVDDGYYPEQTTDIQMAIRAARRDPRCNGLVYCVGGSAGASHSAYMAATGTPGDDQPDLVVLCSGVYDLADLAFLSIDCDIAPDETCPDESCENYLNLPPNSWPQHLPELATASPNTYITNSICPIYVLEASDDSIGIDIQFNSLLAKLNSVGVTETISSRPELGHYKEWVIPVIGNHHAFQYWDQAKQSIIAWLQAGPPQGR